MASPTDKKAKDCEIIDVTGSVAPSDPAMGVKAKKPVKGGCQCELEVNEKGERGTLVVLLLLNAIMFVVEIVLGWRADSTALLADSVDMFADAAVYAVGLYAVGKPNRIKHRAARCSGIFQALLAVLILADIIRRAVSGSAPDSWFIIGVGIGALVVNVVCLALISRYRTGGVHMQASFIFSQNDVIANTLTVVSGVVILFTDQDWIDFVVGGLIILVVLYGSWSILRKSEAKEDETNDNKDILCDGSNGAPCDDTISHPCEDNKDTLCDVKKDDPCCTLNGTKKSESCCPLKSRGCEGNDVASCTSEKDTLCGAAENTPADGEKITLCDFRKVDPCCTMKSDSCATTRSSSCNTKKTPCGKKNRVPCGVEKDGTCCPTTSSPCEGKKVSCGVEREGPCCSTKSCPYNENSACDASKSCELKDAITKERAKYVTSTV